MTSTRPLRAVLGAAAAALTLTLAACGGDDDEAAETTAETAGTEAAGSDTTAAAETTVAATDTSGAPATGGVATGDTTTGSASGEAADRDAYLAAGVESFGETEDDTADCVVNAVLDGVGMEMVAASGLGPEEFWSGSGAPLADAGLTADSPEVVAVAEGVSACEGLVAVLAGSMSDGATDEQISCMEDGGARELLGQSLALSMIGENTDEITTEGDALAESCGLTA